MRLPANRGRSPIRPLVGLSSPGGDRPLASLASEPQTGVAEPLLRQAREQQREAANKPEEESHYTWGLRYWLS